MPRGCLGEGCTALTTGMGNADQCSGTGMSLSSPVGIESNFGLESLSAEKV